MSDATHPGLGKVPNKDLIVGQHPGTLVDPGSWPNRFLYVWAADSPPHRDSDGTVFLHAHVYPTPEFWAKLRTPPVGCYKTYQRLMTSIHLQEVLGTKKRSPNQPMPCSGRTPWALWSTSTADNCLINFRFVAHAALRLEGPVVRARSAWKGGHALASHEGQRGPEQ